MTADAKITVTAGPDAGKAYALSEELVHIGRGADNQVVLSDPTLSEHQASIVRRNGRYAIYSPLAGAVRVDDNEIPAERWVWLPRQATIHVGEGTVLLLETRGNGVAAENPAESTPTPTPGRARPKTTPPGTKRARRKSRGGDSQPHIARFISDRSGERLVKLGEDGQLPALELAELADEQPAERRQKSGANPLLLYGALGFSLVLSLSMLLMSPGGGPASGTADKAAARAALLEFFGEDGADLQPYQTLLRQALVDHSQGDYRAERDAYWRVLRMLNSSDILDEKRNPNGLTGRQTGQARSSDERLREALDTLLEN